MHDGEELADVIAAVLEGALMEELLAAGGVHAAVLQRAGIADAGSVHAVAFGDGLADDGQHGGAVSGDTLAFVVLIRGFKGNFRQFAIFESFVLGVGEPAHLCGAFLPGGEDTAFAALPDDVVFGFGHEVFPWFH